MSAQEAYQALLDHHRATAALAQLGGVVMWDQEVMMPPRGLAQRAEQSAALEGVLHARRTDPRMGEWLERADTGDGAVPAANLRLLRRSFAQATRVPQELATRLARLTANGQAAWAKAREASDFAAFAPHLRDIVAAKREEASALRDGHATLYDALLDQFEPDMTSGVLRPLLESLRPRLTALRGAIAEAEPAPVLEGPFDTQAQLSFAREVASAMGYDFEAGRLDLSVHPFSSGTLGDARITTRLDADDPLGCLYSTIHELGHAIYEQNLPADLAFQPVCHHVSMGVHESQSRLWENQVGRGHAFAHWLWPRFRDALGSGGIASADDFHRAVNRVETGFIRTEADEVHYNLHVLMRFELEEALIEGRLEVDDLEGAWNETFARDFGVTPPDAARGVLQDVHWSAGLFGYFPTYSLGNLYAAQLFAAVGRDIPDLDERLRAGDCAALKGWLTEKVHARGAIVPAARLMEEATGEALSAEPLLDYLEAKFTALYAL